jgi:hypothetical protein
MGEMEKQEMVKKEKNMNGKRGKIERRKRRRRKI